MAAWLVAPSEEDVKKAEEGVRKTLTDEIAKLRKEYTDAQEAFKTESAASQTKARKQLEKSIKDVQAKAKKAQKRLGNKLEKRFGETLDEKLQEFAKNPSDELLDGLSRMVEDKFRPVANQLNRRMEALESKTAGMDRKLDTIIASLDKGKKGKDAKDDKAGAAAA
jgi:hypothetical protein